MPCVNEMEFLKFKYGQERIPTITAPRCFTSLTNKYKDFMDFK